MVARSAVSGREPEVHDVAVRHDVVLALKPQLAGVARACLAAAGDIVVIADGFGADEAALEVLMDDAGGLRRFGASRDRPGAQLPSARR